MNNLSGIQLVIQERARQKRDEGYTDEHDDQYLSGELRDAGIAYAMASDPDTDLGYARQVFPWEEKHWKPKGQKRNLVIGIALLIAELDRLNRIEDSAILVPVCQRESCGKPLRDPNDRVYLLVRGNIKDAGDQCVFCRSCASDIKNGKDYLP